MPRKLNWNDLFNRRGFWLNYYYLALDWDSRQGRLKWKIDKDTEQVMNDLWKSVKGHEVVIRFPSRYALKVQFPDGGAGHRLVLTKPSSRTELVLGWCDPSPYADALRWDEFSSIIECVKKHGRAAFNLAYAPLLLYMYVGVTKEDNGSLRKRLVSDLRKSNIFFKSDLHLFAQCFAPERLHGYSREWLLDSERGWVAKCEYSLRDVDSPYGEFDFAGFKRFMRVVERNATDGH